MVSVRNFIVSDLHGQGKIYTSIIKLLEEEQRKHPEDKVVLYINGDIIDRGPDSIAMLLDVIDRTKHRKGNIEVNLLAGNHELIMYKAIKEREKGYWNRNSEWFLGNNGGQATRKQFDTLSIVRQEEIIDFLEKLPLSKVFDVPILGDRGVVLAHASAIDTTGLTLKDATQDINLFKVLWIRKNDPKCNFGPVGRKDYFSIVGHTAVKDICFDKQDNVLYTDCGCANLSPNSSKDVQVPLIELNYDGENLNVIKFNKNGDIKSISVLEKDKNRNLVYSSNVSIPIWDRETRRTSPRNYQYTKK